MLRIRTILVPSVVAMAIAAGCTVNENNGPTPGTHANDGTTQIQSQSAHALVNGHVDASITGDIHFAVNGSTRDVVVAPDSSFVVRDVPTGEVTLACDAGQIKGTLTITNVQPGEIIEVSVRAEGDAIVIVIVKRTPATEPPREVDSQSGDALEITESHVCYWFKPGHYNRDVIVSGDDVHLFGAAHNSCLVDDLTFLDKKLEIRGSDVSVFDVELKGDLVISGKRAHIQDTCTKCFNEGCKHACEEDEKVHGKCGGHEGGNCDKGECHHDDAGAPPPVGTDAGVKADGGSTSDAGPTNDAGVTTDGGASNDAGASTDATSADVSTGG